MTNRKPLRKLAKFGTSGLRVNAAATRFAATSIVAAGLAALLIAAEPAAADAQAFQSLLSFSGSTGATLGAYPESGLTLSGSTLYGMTTRAGANNDGTVFRVNTDGSGYQTLLSFTGTSGQTNGYFPTGNLTLSGSTLYGMTLSGGTGGGRQGWRRFFQDAAETSGIRKYTLPRKNDGMRK